MPVLLLVVPVFVTLILIAAFVLLMPLAVFVLVLMLFVIAIFSVPLFARIPPLLLVLLALNVVSKQLLPLFVI